MKGQAGYTLLELLVVLVIMGLITASIPGIALPGITSVRFSGKIQTVTSQLVAAHEVAIETGQTVRLKLADLAVGGGFVTAAATSPTFLFYPDGSASGGALAVHYLGRQRMVTINQITGQVIAQ